MLVTLSTRHVCVRNTGRVRYVCGFTHLCVPDLVGGVPSRSCFDVVRHVLESMCARIRHAGHVIFPLGRETQREYNKHCL